MTNREGEVKDSAGIPELVWENECRLVITKEDDEHHYGEMGLCHEDGSEVQIQIYSHDPKGKHEVFKRLENVPVRVIIDRVPGGNS